MSKKPNILFLMSDEHRFDVAGFAGNKIIRTPTLDFLSKTGVTFHNAYTPSPICIPGRQCMMAGQLPKTCNCQNFGEDLAPNYMTFAKRFSQYGYKTVCSGKLHHLGPDQMQGWTSRLSGEIDIHSKFIDGLIPEEFAKYTPAPGQGKWSNQKELEEAKPLDGPYQKHDRQAIQTSLDFLERYFKDASYNRPSSHFPLFHKVSLLQPHYPYFGDEELFNYYLNKVEIYNEKPCDHPILSKSQLEKPVNATEATIRRATASYYAMTETVDRHFAKILQSLKDLGQNIDDWIIVYTSDHGEMLGQHGIWEKTRFYEASVRVPLIIRWPKHFNGDRHIHENVNLCDLFATLCDLAELEIPQNLDSRSLKPLLQGNTKNWKNESISQFGNHHLMIKQDELKYQYYGDTIAEVLFDLKKDPKETTNLISQPEYSDALKHFRNRLGELGHGPNKKANYKNAGYTQ